MAILDNTATLVTLDRGLRANICTKPKILDFLSHVGDKLSIVSHQIPFFPPLATCDMSL